jgi:hypothetical protein
MSPRLWEPTVQYLCHHYLTIGAHLSYFVEDISNESPIPSMGKRKAVPTALHAELSEYASLLRALRTADTLDLSSQLTKAQAGASTSQQSVHNANDDNAEDGRGPNTLSSRDITPSVLSSSKPTRSLSSNVKDNWTRWPLLEGDIRAPEFGFQDEIKMIASEVLKLQRQEDPDDGNHRPEEEDEEIRLPRSFLDSLTLACSTHLSQILSVLAAHVPLTEKSMQNRIKPIGWQGMLDIVAVSGLVDPKSVSCIILLCFASYLCLIFFSCNRTIEDAERRMERVYGSSQKHC